MQNSEYPLSERDRWFLPIFLIFLGVHLFWMSSLRLYPFVDVPYHLAESTIYRYYNDPGNQFANYYSKEFALLPNIFYMLFCASPLFPTVEIANRVYFCLYTVLFPASIVLVIRQLNGNPWFSLFSFLLLYNYNVQWGFVGFMLSIPAFLFFFYLLLRSLNQDSLLWGVIRSFWLLLVFFLHGLTGLFSLMFFCFHTLYHYKGRYKTLAKKSLVALPTLLIAGQWWFFYERSPGEHWDLNSIQEYFTGAYLDNLNLRATLLINDNKWLFPDVLGACVALVLSIFILVPVVPWLRKQLQRRFQDNAPKSIVSVYLLILSSLASWFFMPGRVQGQFFVFDRFSVFFMLSMIILASATLRRPSAYWKAWIIAGCLLHCLLSSHYFYEFETESASFTEEILPTGNNKTLCALLYDRGFRGRNVYQHFPLYYIVWKQGISCARFIDLKYITLIRRKASIEELPKYLEQINPHAFKYRNQYRNIDYILVRSRKPKYIGKFRLVRTSGKWFLYQRSE